MIPYNRPYKSGNELATISKALEQENLGGDGTYMQLCHEQLEKKYGFARCLLTHSCSASLEMAARICDLKPGDEVIVPSFAYVTTASAFAANGATLRFADSEVNRPHINPQDIARLITDKTRAIVIVHYAGAACDMEAIMALVKAHGLLLIEDAAHAINVQYQGKYLGTFGHLATFSFHETKNIHCGEGGLLVINEAALENKAVSIWHEGTNRQDFKKGLSSKYEWHHLGSSYQPSELTASFLHAQLGAAEEVTRHRLQLWNQYHDALAGSCSPHQVTLPSNQEAHNAHIFYLKCPDKSFRDALIAQLSADGVMAIFHYLPLHKSPYWLKEHKEESLAEAEKWADCLVRLPLYHSLTAGEQNAVVAAVEAFFRSR